MRLFAIAIAGALFSLIAAVQLQYGPEWRVNAAVEAAIARGDLKHAREMATTAEHWASIVQAGRKHRTHMLPQPGLARLTAVRGQEAIGKRQRATTDDNRRSHCSPTIRSFRSNANNSAGG